MVQPSQSILTKRNKMPQFIIIIDKTPFLADTIEIVISRYYPNLFSILAYNNTTAAFNMIEELSIKKETIALIICDYQMPGLTGFEFLNLINTFSPGSTKVLSTNFIKLSEYQNLILEPSVDFVLEKPFNTNSLINIIQITVKLQDTLINQHKNVNTIQSLKNSLSTLREKHQDREHTLLTISESLNAFYFRINLNNLLLDIYSVSETIFGYESSSFNTFDSFLAIIDPDDQNKLVESIKKIKVMLTKDEKLYLRIIAKNNKSILTKSLLIAEEIDEVTGTKSIIGFIQNITVDIAEYKNLKHEQ